MLYMNNHSQLSLNHAILMPDTMQQYRIVYTVTCLFKPETPYTHSKDLNQRPLRSFTLDHIFYCLHRRLRQHDCKLLEPKKCVQGSDNKQQPIKETRRIPRKMTTETPLTTTNPLSRPHKPLIDTSPASGLRRHYRTQATWSTHWAMSLSVLACLLVCDNWFVQLHFMRQEFRKIVWTYSTNGFWLPRLDWILDLLECYP